MINYVVNNVNPFRRKAKECLHVNTQDFSCIQCMAYEQANSPDHVDCFEPKIMPWTHNWTRFDDVQRMLPIY